MTASPTMGRRLGLTDAVAIGVGSMVGAGIFAAFAPAALAAGAGLLIGLVIAAIIAFCNATSTAQLGVQYPTSGGSYIYGRERLGEWVGFTAGWSFVVGKTASCAAMALTFAAYAAPAGWERPVAALAVLALCAVNLFGVTRTAALTKVIVTVVLGILLLVITIAIPSVADVAADDTAPLEWTAPGGWYGVLQAAGLLFFAFAGYARIATMGEEVKNPRTVIPRAILISLTAVLVLYAVIGFLLVVVIGPAALAVSAAPLIDVVTTAGSPWAAPIVQVGAAVGSLGALLALIAGIGRTSLAMARHDDLPAAFAALHPRTHVPYRAEIALALIVVVLVVTLDVRQAIGFSSFGVLLYYLIANVAAFTQARADRRYPRVLQIVGACGCLLLVATLPWQSLAGGVVVIAVGFGYRAVRKAVQRT